MFTGLKTQNDFSSCFLEGIITETHELVKLKEFLDWKKINWIYRDSFPKAKNKSRPGASSKHTDLAVGLILLKQIYKMSDRALIRAVHENMAIMRFCSVSPMDIQRNRAEGKRGLMNHTTLVAIRKRMGKKNLKKIEREFFQQIRKKGLVKGKTLIVDTTSLEKKILYPTEVNLLKRIIEHAEMVVQGVIRKKDLVKSAVIKAANKLAKVYYSAKHKTTELLNAISGKMVVLARQTMAKAGKAAGKASGLKRVILEKIHRKVREIGGKILEQIESKLAGKKVSDKIVSYYEPHVRALPKGKIHKPCEFGTKATIAMSGNGFVTDYDLHTGNPNEKSLLPAIVKRHARKFGEDFKQLTADAEFADSQQTKEMEDKYGITAGIPEKKGKGVNRGMERKQKRVYDKRSAIEAKISEGKRVHGLDKSDYEGLEGDWICLILGAFALNAKKIMRILSPPLEA